MKLYPAMKHQQLEEIVARDLVRTVIFVITSYVMVEMVVAWLQDTRTLHYQPQVQTVSALQTKKSEENIVLFNHNHHGQPFIFNNIIRWVYAELQARLTS